MVFPLYMISPITNQKGPSRLQTENLWSTENPVSILPEQEPTNINIKWSDANSKYVIESTALLKSVRLTSRVEPKELPSILCPPENESQEPCKLPQDYQQCLIYHQLLSTQAPLAKVTHDNYSVVERLMTSVHTNTASQRMGWPLWQSVAWWPCSEHHACIHWYYQASGQVARSSLSWMGAH